MLLVRKVPTQRANILINTLEVCNHWALSAQHYDVAIFNELEQLPSGHFIGVQPALSNFE